MDILLSAVASDLVSRFVSSIVRKCHKPTTMEEKLVRLRRVLLRARTIVEEAEGRHITNHGMHLQLRQLRSHMYQGYYMLDTFKKHAMVSQSYDLSLDSDGINKLQSAFESLEATINDMKEFVIILMDCPRIPCQPYDTYLFMERCMFGRNMEKGQIINFLLQPCSFSPPILSVLPIIGPCQVGKRTLVEHVSSEERVRKHFSQIVHFDGNDLLGHDHSIVPVSSGRFLLVINFVSNVDEEAWRRFYSSICNTHSDSKIILISRLEQVSNLGTAQALSLQRLHQDEYWYFFKVLAFGSANPEEHPKLVSVAMKLAAILQGSFMAANIIAMLLRSNPSVHFWRHVLKMVEKWIQLHTVDFGENPYNLAWKDRPIYAFWLAKDAPLYLWYNRRKIEHSMQQKLPRVKFIDIINGRIVPNEEKLDVLAWQSSVPPYYIYVVHCALKKGQQVVPKKKCLKRMRELQQKLPADDFVETKL